MSPAPLPRRLRRHRQQVPHRLERQPLSALPQLDPVVRWIQEQPARRPPSRQPVRRSQLPHQQVSLRQPLKLQQTQLPPEHRLRAMAQHRPLAKWQSPQLFPARPSPTELQPWRPLRRPVPVWAEPPEAASPPEPPQA
jgi:hypothetical protein